MPAWVFESELKDGASYEKDTSKEVSKNSNKDEEENCRSVLDG
jgi:hypothetical protein